MSILKFELKKEHIKLLKHLNWSELTDNNAITTITESSSPFGGFDYYEDMGIILYGKPDNFNPFEEDPFEWTDEQKQEMDKLLSELPTAIEVILNAETFQTGHYKTKFHIRNWNKIK
jgi:hypothetical protein